MKYKSIIIGLLTTLSSAIAKESSTEPPHSWVNGQHMAANIQLQIAVDEFNRQAAKDEVGKTQPPLTVKEVVANIRGIIREDHPMPQEVYDALQAIADKLVFPDKASLGFISTWRGFEGYDYKVWWIDLAVNTGYAADTRSYLQYYKHGGIRIRDTKLESTPSRQTEKDKALEKEAHENPELRKIRERMQTLKMLAKAHADGKWTEDEFLEVKSLVARMLEIARKMKQQIPTIQ